MLITCTRGPLSVELPLLAPAAKNFQELCHHADIIKLIPSFPYNPTPQHITVSLPFHCHAQRIIAPSTVAMLSLRTVARSAPRALSRMTASSLRQSARPSAFIKMSSALRPAHAAAAFSTTVGRRAAESETDDELSAKLESEIQIEEDMKANEQQPASVKDFLDNSPFELVDTPGQEVVKLTRSFGDEQ